LLGLSSILDIAKSGQKILLTSFGSGAGSDSFSITVTSLLQKRRSAAVLLKDMIEDKEYIDYAHYLKFRKKLKGVKT